MWNKDNAGNWYLDGPVMTGFVESNGSWECDNEGNWFLESPAVTDSVKLALVA